MVLLCCSAGKGMMLSTRGPGPRRNLAGTLATSVAVSSPFAAVLASPFAAGGWMGLGLGGNDGRVQRESERGAKSINVVVGMLVSDARGWRNGSMQMVVEGV